MLLLKVYIYMYNVSGITHGGSNMKSSWPDQLQQKLYHYSSPLWTAASVKRTYGDAVRS
jgi:hypothetical protein